jgi:hypothetical protein
MRTISDPNLDFSKNRRLLLQERTSVAEWRMLSRLSTSAALVEREARQEESTTEESTRNTDKKHRPNRLSGFRIRSIHRFHNALSQLDQCR